MQLKNIDRLLLFREAPDGHVLTLDELRGQYTIDPDGTNFYYGINQQNANDSAGTSSALNPTHRAFLNSFLASLTASADDEKTLVLGLEPPNQDKPYAFVASNLDLVERLAGDLSNFQEQARNQGKRLNISVRYASEMNDGGQTQGHDPAAYRSTFVQVRQIFSKAAPSILFAFSPALRADLPEELIGQYWPGDAYVDVVGGTWYIGSSAQSPASLANMRAYFLHRVVAGKAFAIDELGGCNAAGAGNDVMLQQMLHDIEALQLQAVTFRYVTIFLQGKWGSDATLAFLKG